MHVVNVLRDLTSTTPLGWDICNLVVEKCLLISPAILRLWPWVWDAPSMQTDDSIHPFRYWMHQNHSDQWLCSCPTGIHPDFGLYFLEYDSKPQWQDLSIWVRRVGDAFKFPAYKEPCRAPGPILPLILLLYLIVWRLGEVSGGCIQSSNVQEVGTIWHLRVYSAMRCPNSAQCIMWTWSRMI